MLRSLIVLGLLCCTSLVMAEKPQQIETWNSKDSTGAAATVKWQYVLTMVIENSPFASYVAVHNPPGKSQLIEGLPPIAVAVDGKEIRVQLADGEWWDNVSLAEVIAAVKKSEAGKKKGPAKAKIVGQKSAAVDAQSPFQLAAWGRGGCSACQADQASQCSPTLAPVESCVTCPPAIPVERSILGDAITVEGQPLRNLGRQAIWRINHPFGGRFRR